jgi:hypothetical protein
VSCGKRLKFGVVNDRMAILEYTHNLFPSKTRVLPHHLLDGVSVRKLVQNNRDWNPCSGYHGLAVAHSRIDLYELVHRHAPSLAGCAYSVLTKYVWRTFDGHADRALNLTRPAQALFLYASLSRSFEIRFHAPGNPV